MYKTKSKFNLFVSNIVKEKRTNAKMSQSALAYEMNVTVGFIGKAECPKCNTHYNLNHINQLAIIFECSPRDLLPEQSLNLSAKQISSTSTNK